MLRRNAFAFVCLVAFPIGAVAETRVDMDRSKDFRQYRTFTVEVSPPIRNGEVDENNTIEVNRLREMSPLYEMAKEGIDLKTFNWARD